ncbi:hypothetical protein QYF36_017188 [Acer negundo]|nr:hypothetical protein QYF36_017188 [Acer negundo]
MDKSWIRESRVSKTFEDGVIQFLDFTFANSIDGRIKCPYKNCNNAFRCDKDIVKEHMICDGLNIRYFSNIWIYHGELDSTQARLNNEQPVQVDDMHRMLRNAFGVLDDGGGEFDSVDLSGGGDDNNGSGDENIDGGNKENPNDDAETFYKLLKDAEQELYPGCKKFTKLSFIVRLFHIKCLYGLSDKSITVLLELFKEALPEEKAQETKCTVCGTSQWKEMADDANQSSLSIRKIPAKLFSPSPTTTNVSSHTPQTIIGHRNYSFETSPSVDHPEASSLVHHSASAEADIESQSGDVGAETHAPICPPEGGDAATGDGEHNSGGESGSSEYGHGGALVVTVAEP